MMRKNHARRRKVFIHTDQKEGEVRGLGKVDTDGSWQR
jgi:hypothetical protein